MKLNTNMMIEIFWQCLQAVPVTLKLTLVTLIFSLPIGFFFGWVRFKKIKIISQIFGIYLSFMRGTPFILQLYLIYTYLPSQLNQLFILLKIPVNVFKIENIVFAYIVFILSEIAALTEVFRAALESVDKGQIEAAYACGLTTMQAYRRIILPQAIAGILPVLCTSTTNLIKQTSLAFSIAVVEITGAARIEAASTMEYVEAYLDIFLLYIIIIIIVEALFKRVEKNLKSYKAA